MYLNTGLLWGFEVGAAEAALGGVSPKQGWHHAHGVCAMEGAAERVAAERRAALYRVTETHH